MPACREVAVTEMDPEVQRLFCESSWPGNIRRLENAIISALAHGDPRRSIIIIEDLPDWLRGGSGWQSGDGAGGVPPEPAPGPDAKKGREAFPEPVDDTDQTLQGRKKITTQNIVCALEQTNGHHHKAARLLGISRAHLFQLRKTFDIRSNHREYPLP